ncbi:MAG: PulJ/GspJ family protein [Oceanisphaera sp.]
MKHRGFTLLELVIVLALISISSLVGFRFISDMAHSQVSATERGQALAGARFAIERLRRELSNAYGPSIYVSSNSAGEARRCLNFVPVIAAGNYQHSVSSQSAIFTLPTEPHNTDLPDRYLAINAPNAAPNSGQPWDNYPTELDNVALLNDTLILDGTGGTRSFSEMFANTPNFSYVGSSSRYTLLKAEQITYCLTANHELIRTRKVKDDATNSLMLTGLSPSTDKVFGAYNINSQLVTVDFTLATRDGDLVLSSQLQVGYEP